MACRCARPAFAAHFNDSISDDPALETVPFGSNEGSDIWEGGQRRSEFSPKSSEVTDVSFGSTGAGD